MTKLIINNSDDVLMYPVISDSIPNRNNVLDEWIRFLSYFKPEELLFLNELDSKTTDQLTIKEMEEYHKIKKQMEMSELFTKYKNKNCSKEEHELVVKHMDNSLKDFMKERLTEEEIKQSRKILSEFRKMSEFELGKYIDRQMTNYNNLTILEAYILYEVREIKNYKYNSELNEKIRTDKSEREIALKRRYINDYGL